MATHPNFSGNHGQWRPVCYGLWGLPLERLEMAKNININIRSKETYLKNKILTLT